MSALLWRTTLCAIHCYSSEGPGTCYFNMNTLKEPLVTLGLIAVMLVIEIKPTKLEFLLPSMPQEACTSFKDMGIKQWFSFLFYYHRDRGHMAYNIFSFLWKGILLEGCLGSRQFSLLVSALLFTYDGIMILASLLWKLLGEPDNCLLSCHTGISGLLFALIFPLNRNYEVYRSIRSGPSQILYRATLSVLYAVEIAVFYHLCPELRLYGPLCGILAGFIYSYQSVLFSNWNSWQFSNRRQLHSPHKIIETKNTVYLTETITMVWTCHACTYDNSITSNPYACAICEIPRLEMIESPKLQLNPENAGLVWNCPTCTLENGVYFHACEICETPRPLLA